MKKVLIIAHLFHASPRIPGLAKYLPEFGWQPVILTTSIGEKPSSRFGPPDDIKRDIRVIETPYHDVLGFWKNLFRLNPDERIASQLKKRFGETDRTSSYVDSFIPLCGAIAGYPDLERGWKPFAIKAGSELLKNENIDAMISSSSPVTSHIIAKELKIKYKIPWIADLRDLWTQNHSYPYGNIRMFFERRLELETLHLVDVLVTVSSLWAEELRTLHSGKKTCTITNGFDPANVAMEPIDLTSKFTITYTGNIYTGRQDPSKLLDALRDLISDNTMNPNDIEVKFYGPLNEVLAKEIEKYGLSDVVTQYGIVPREFSFARQRESQILLLLNWDILWDDRREKGWYPLKLFEYMAAKRPILAIGGFGDDVVERLLDETKTGVYCKSVDDTKTILRNLYLEFKHHGQISYNGKIDKINRYSYREMARKFAEILDSVI